MGNQHIIELNGQKYDALTGKIISSKPIEPNKHKTKSTARNMDFVSVPKNHITHHKTQKSSTLMRTTVPKPTVHTSKSSQNKSNSVITTHSTLSTKSVKNYPKSPLVSHFGSNHTVPKTPSHPSKSSQTNTAPSHSRATPKDIYADAISASDSHNQPKPKKHSVHKRIARKLRISPSMVSTGSFAMAFLIIGGLIAYQNVPGLTMRLASSRSGVHGSLPKYQPSGFSLNGSIAYKPGQITINYKSNSDGRNFKIIQANSEWNSEALEENFFKEDQTVQVAQNKGKTVFIYDDYNATWVDGGVWYRIEGESKLNGDQLQQIVGSL